MRLDALRYRKEIKEMKTCDFDHLLTINNWLMFIIYLNLEMDFGKNKGTNDLAKRNPTEKQINFA